VDTFVAVIKELMAQSKQYEKINNQHDKTNHKRFHPRILICGGDGTIAWGLSVLDRVLLRPSVLSLYEELDEFAEIHDQLLREERSAKSHDERSHAHDNLKKEQSFSGRPHWNVDDELIPIRQTEIQVERVGNSQQMQEVLLDSNNNEAKYQDNDNNKSKNQTKKERKCN